MTPARHGQTSGRVRHAAGRFAILIILALNAES